MSGFPVVYILSVEGHAPRAHHTLSGAVEELHMHVKKTLGRAGESVPGWLAQMRAADAALDRSEFESHKYIDPLIWTGPGHIRVPRLATAEQMVFLVYGAADITPVEMARQ